MKRNILIAVALFLSVGTVDVSAQNFLNKLKKTVKKEVENRVEKEVKKQVNKGMEAITGKESQPAKAQSSEKQPQTGSSQPSREERNERHIQLLVEKGTAVRTVKATGTPQSNAPVTGKTNGHEWVDLGLPSGLR